MAERREVRIGRRRRADSQSVAADPVVELADYVADLAYALLERDIPEVRRLLRAPISAKLPREVRAEAMQFTRLSEASVRAPIETLRFAHRINELHMGAGGPDENAQQIDLFGEEPRPSW